MPSSNKTSCGLNQWISTDQPMMADFNRDNALLDAALAASKNAVSASLDLPKDKILLGDGGRQIQPTFYSVADTAGDFYRLTVSDSTVSLYIDGRYCENIDGKTLTFSMDVRLVSGNPTGYLSAYIPTSAGYRGWDGDASTITPTPSWQTCTISDMQGLTDGSNSISLSTGVADSAQGIEFVIDIRNPRLLDADGNNLFPSSMVGLGEYHPAVEEADADCLIPTLQRIRETFEKNMVTAPSDLSEDKILLGNGGKSAKAGECSISKVIGCVDYTRFTVTEPTAVYLSVSVPSAKPEYTLSIKARCVASDYAWTPNVGPMTSNDYYWDTGGYLALPVGQSWKPASKSGISNTDNLALFFYNAGTYDIQDIHLTDADDRDVLDHAAFQAQGEYHPAVEENDENLLLPSLQKVREVFKGSMVTAPSDLTEDKILLGDGERNVKAGVYSVDAAVPEEEFVRFTLSSSGFIELPNLGTDSKCTLTLEARCVSGKTGQIGPNIEPYGWDGGGYLDLPANGAWKSAVLSNISSDRLSILGITCYNAGTYDIRRIHLTDPAGNDVIDHAAFQALGEYHPAVEETDENLLLPSLQKVREVFKGSMVTAPSDLSEDKILLGNGGKSAKAGNYAVDAVEIPPAYLRFSAYDGTSVTFSPDSDALNANKPYTLTLEARCVSFSGHTGPKIGPNNSGDHWDNGDLLMLDEGGEWKSATLSGISDPVLKLIFYVDGTYDIRNIKITDADGKDISVHYNRPSESQYVVEAIDTPDNHLLPTLQRVRETASELCGEQLDNLESMRVGSSCVTGGKNAFAQGDHCSANGNNAFSQGNACMSNGERSHAEGGWCQANGDGSHAEGNNNHADAPASHAEGDSNQISASCDACHVEGIGNAADGAKYAHIEGRDNRVSAISAHAEGYQSRASAEAAHAQGFHTTASGYAAHAQGQYTSASGSFSHAGGDHAQASGEASFAHGSFVKATANNVAIGRYNKVPAEHTWSNGPTGDAFVIGNGSGESSRSNAFRVSAAGQVYGANFNTSGADYAEFFEWADGNPDGQDRTGLFVTLDGDKLRLAQDSSEYVLGVISCSPSVIGNAQSEQWVGQYVRDVFGRIQYEETEVEEEVENIAIPALTGSLYHPAEYTTEVKTRTVGQDETGKDITEAYQEPVLVKDAWIEENAVLQEGRTERVVTRPASRMVLPKRSPDYDPNREYLPRELRPEWSPVGMLGRLVVTDDGSCRKNGCCAPKNGIATAAESGYRVIRRLDDSHVEIILK